MHTVHRRKMPCRNSTYRFLNNLFFSHDVSGPTENSFHLFRGGSHNEGAQGGPATQITVTVRPDGHNMKSGDT